LGVDDFEARGRRFSVVRLASANRNAWARLRGDVLTITIPARWPEKEKLRVGDDLLNKARKAIERGKWTGEEAGKVGFCDGQTLHAMGRDFRVLFITGKRFSGKVSGGQVVVVIDPSHPKRHEKASSIAKDKIVRTLMPELRARVEKINGDHFQAAIKRVSVRDNISRWGSCSRDGSISLNLRLLFMPQGILDYVIVHELAHTRYRSNGKRFWALVESVMPDHAASRKWLKENGWSYPRDETVPKEGVAAEISKAKEEGQLRIADFVYEEPY
jgi:predicted metal-dependent hydrolase